VSLTLIAGAVHDFAPIAEAGAPAPGARRYWMRLAVCSVALGTAWLLSTLWWTTTDWGKAAAAAALVEGAQGPCVLLDQSERRVAFVAPPPALAAGPPARVVTSVFDPRLADLGALEAPRFGVLGRRLRSASLFERMGAIGTPIARGEAGAFRWLLVERDPLLGRLELESARFHPRQGDSFALASDALGRRAGPEGSHLAVARRRCPIEGRAREMLWAHPSAEGSLELGFSKPRGATRLVLAAGFLDSALSWGLAPVRIEVRAAGEPHGHFVVDNLPGLEWELLRMPAHASAVSIYVETLDDRRRWLCLDGFWL
jgi:hypothetical protein